MKKTLFDQTQIGGMKLKNRFFRSATYDGVAGEGGHWTEPLFQVYENLAKGGVGTIITGLTAVDGSEQLMPGQAGLYDDSFIGEYHQLAERVHAHGANIVVQLACLGSQSFYKKGSGKTLWGPSAVEDLAYKVTPNEMTKQDILFVQEAFAAAALRAKQAGVDGVQLHAAHGYLLSKFLTPYYNRRNDEYGGSIENRARMTVETYRAVREKVGPEYPILVKINSEDYMDQGMTFAECRYVCQRLAELGINAVEVSGGSSSSRSNEGSARKISPEQESYYKTYAAEIAKEIGVPVISVGGHRDFASLTEIVNETPIAYIALCRPLIYENDLITRWQNGDLGRAKCVSCNKCFRIGGTRCVFNKKAED
ncbi:MAG: NADH:flavin oxidoreductase [Firmicutes bacterium]|nr:NADH:flavin oxidoreductase [Bacillota bacterium]